MIIVVFDGGCMTRDGQVIAEDVVDIVAYEQYNGKDKDK